MVYRLVPSYKFQPESHFGMEDMTKAPVAAGWSIGLVVGIVLSWVLAAYALKADPSSKLYKMFVKIDNKGKPTVFKNWEFWVSAIVLCLVCVSAGTGAGVYFLQA